MLFLCCWLWCLLPDPAPPGGEPISLRPSVLTDCPAQASTDAATESGERLPALLVLPLPLLPLALLLLPFAALW